jgi:hypothetical protein
MVARAAQLGEEGDVDGAIAVTQQAENLGKQHEVLHKQLTEPERTMTVCDICGVFINSTDNEQRRLVSGWEQGCSLRSGHTGVWTDGYATIRCEHVRA